MKRRTFIRSLGPTLGAASVGTVTGAQQEDESIAEPTVTFDTIEDDGRQYAASIAYDPTTGEKEGLILPTTVDELSDGGDIVSLEDPTFYEIDESVLDEIDGDAILSRAERHDREATPGRGNGRGPPHNPPGRANARRNPGRGQELEDIQQPGALWDLLFDAGGIDLSAADFQVEDNIPNESADQDVTSASATNFASVAGSASQTGETVLQRAVRNLASGAKKVIRRVGAYYVRSPDGTSCDAIVNSSSHRQLGVSIDFHQNLKPLGATLIGGAIGVILGNIILPGVGMVVGGVIGGIVGYALQHVTRSNVLTVVLRDRDSCSLGVCAPGIRPYVSGLWMDQTTDLLRIDSVSDLPLVHLQDGVRLPTGHREVVQVS